MMDKFRFQRRAESEFEISDRKAGDHNKYTTLVTSIMKHQTTAHPNKVQAEDCQIKGEDIVLLAIKAHPKESMNGITPGV